MIKFEHCNGDLSKAVFGGSTEDLVADLCLQMSLIYGAMYNQDKDAAEKFKIELFMCFAESEINNKVFSTEIYDQIHKSGDYACGSITLGDLRELERQLGEILNENK